MTTSETRPKVARHPDAYGQTTPAPLAALDLDQAAPALSLQPSLGASISSSAMRAKKSDCMDTVRFWLSVASLFGLFGVAVLLLTLVDAFGQGIAALPFNFG
jgi:hypothetical protein